MKWVAAPWQDTELDALTQWSSRASPWAIWSHLHGMTSCGLQGATWNGRLLEELSGEQDRITGNATRHSSPPSSPEKPSENKKTLQPGSYLASRCLVNWWINKPNKYLMPRLSQQSPTPTCQRISNALSDTGSCKPLAWQFSYVWCGMPWQDPIF